MKVVAHNEVWLAIQDGSALDPRRRMERSPRNRFIPAIALLSGLGLLGLAVGWILNKIPDRAAWQAILAGLLLAGVGLGAGLTRNAEEKPLYLFDKSSGFLEVYQGDMTWVYRLEQIVSVTALCIPVEDPPPAHWRSIVIRFKTGEELVLHPGHDRPEHQAQMIALIQAFLNLSDR